MAGREAIQICMSKYILTLGSWGPIGALCSQCLLVRDASVHDTFLGRCVASGGDTAVICIRDIMSCYMITQTLHISVIKIGVPPHFITSNLLYVQPNACDNAEHF